MFCSKCGAQLNDNEMFCGKCGEKTEIDCYTYRSKVCSNQTMAKNANKTHWILSFLGQLICLLLFFLPTIKLEALWNSENVSIINQVSEEGYGVIYVILLILFSCSLFVMLLPIIQNKSPKASDLLFMKAMAVLFFVVNVIVYIALGNVINEQGYGFVDYSLNVWGWLYIIISAFMIVDLMVLSSKVKMTK